MRAVLRALFASPEFWAPAARRAKIKSPLELAASALRATGADLLDPAGTVDWIARMGQPLYAYQAPTGYPDRAEAWVNAGALLNRMNFGLQLAGGEVPGVHLDLPALTGGREPESRQAALATYAALLMPERDLAATLARLAPAVRRPDLAARVAQATPPAAAAAARDQRNERDEMAIFAADAPPAGAGPAAAGVEPAAGAAALAQVVGVILGSPEFQRR